jgi:hyperosmotically inducible periplasmic protein
MVMKMKITARALIAGAALALVVSTGALAADRPDSWITMKTKIALMTTEGVDTWDLNVDTVSGAVTLHGKVASEAAKEKAESVAKGIEGVTSVKNVLQVVAKPDRKIVDKQDDAVKESVQKAFDADPALKDSGIKVASVNKGVVLLSGDTKTLEANLRAVEVARAIPGVRRVASEVTVSGS